MTAPTWADRSRPVAERVELAMLDFSMDDATEAYRRELVADVAAAARLAREAADAHATRIWPIATGLRSRRWPPHR